MTGDASTSTGEAEALLRDALAEFDGQPVTPERVRAMRRKVALLVADHPGLWIPRPTPDPD